MKSLVSCVSSGGSQAATTINSSSVSPSGGVSGGRVVRRRDVENEEIHTYLSKLKELVPFMPRNRKLSKLEVIEHVIDYIIDLQDALVDGQLHSSPVVAPASRHHHHHPNPLSSPSSPLINSSHPLLNQSRTPLGVLAPNTILTPISSPSSSQQQTISSVFGLEKSSSSSVEETKSTLRPTRPVSC